MVRLVIENYSVLLLVVCKDASQKKQCIKIMRAIQVNII